MNEIVFGFGYTTYSPTRKQVERGLQGEHAKARAFYNLTAKYNYLTYTLKNKKVSKNKTYLDYMLKNGDQNVDGNSGIFNNKKVLSEKEVAELKENIGNTKSIIWHGFISFNEEQTKRFQDQDSCIHFLNHTLSTLFENSHIKMENVDIFASLHTDTSHHHHIHFSFYEKTPSRKDKSGEKKFSEKGNFEKQNLNNFMITSGLYLEDTKQNYHAARDMAIVELKKISQSINHDKNLQGVQRRIVELAEKLPKNGRPCYNSKALSQDIKNDVDSIAQEIILANKPYAEAYKSALKEIAEREKAAQRIIKENKMVVISQNNIKEKDVANIHDEKVQEKLLKGEMSDTRYKYVLDQECGIAQIDKLRADFKGRIGNAILGMATSINIKVNFGRKSKQNIKVNYKRGENIKAKNMKKIEAKIKRGAAEKELWKLLHKKDLDKKIQTDFSRELHKAEFEIKKENNEKQAYK